MHSYVLMLAMIFVGTFMIQSAVADEVIMQRDLVFPRDMQGIEDERRVVEGQRRKKPFCNAFTGCGRKRSDESMGTLAEMNSEPAVEQLSREILSEAKLWEALQEARMELLRKKQMKKIRRNQMMMRN